MRAPIAIFLALSSSCARESPSPSAIRRDPVGEASSVADANAAPRDSAPTDASPFTIDLAGVIECAPVGSHVSSPQCDAPFPLACRWKRGELEELYRATWLPSAPAGHPFAIVSPTEAGAKDARCYAAGPHTAFNPGNWCCRE